MGAFNPRLDISDSELFILPEEVVGQLSTKTRNRYVEIRAFVFTAERLLQKLAISYRQPSE